MLFFCRAVIMTKMVNETLQTWTVNEQCGKEVQNQILETDSLRMNPRFTTLCLRNHEGAP